MQKWEYAELASAHTAGKTIVTLKCTGREGEWMPEMESDDPLLEALRHLGEDGWELVAVVLDGGQTRFYLKRMIDPLAGYYAQMDAWMRDYVGAPKPKNGG
mgnify:CR=1 FL=1